MKTNSKNQTAVVARIAGEDIQRGDYVTVFHEIVELPPYLWNCTEAELPTGEPVRLRYLPGEASMPSKVIAVCLPFVYVKRPCGDVNVVDIRQQQLVRLDRDHSRHVWKQIRKCLKRKKK